MRSLCSWHSTCCSLLYLVNSWMTTCCSLLYLVFIIVCFICWLTTCCSLLYLVVFLLSLLCPLPGQHHALHSNSWLPTCCSLHYLVIIMLSTSCSSSLVVYMWMDCLRWASKRSCSNGHRILLRRGNRYEECTWFANIMIYLVSWLYTRCFLLYLVFILLSLLFLF